MIGCDKWRDDLLDAALGLRAASGLEEHLVSCSACREALAGLRERSQQMEAGVHSLVNAEGPSAAFRGRLIESIEARRASGFGWRGPGGVLVASAALAVLGIMLTLSVNRRGGPGDSATPRSTGMAISEWRSPTDAVLRSSAADFLRSSPRLGETYFPMGTSHESAGPDDQRRNP